MTRYEEMFITTIASVRPVLCIGAFIALPISSCLSSDDPSAETERPERVVSTIEALSLSGQTFNVNEAHGGSGGGSRYPLGCNPAQVLVGFHGHDGQLVDQLSSVCATLNPDGSLGNLEYDFPFGGGSGGNPFWKTCPQNQFVAAMAYGVSGGVIARLMMYCASQSEPRSNWAEWVFAAGPPYGDLEYDNCNELGGDNAVVGFEMRSGTYIDSMQTKCQAINP